MSRTLEGSTSVGFELRGPPPGTYGYLILGRGQIELHFWESPTSTRSRPTTPATCVADADALHAEWEAVGILSDPETGSRLMPPGDTDYGLREFALVDRSENLIRVGSPAG